jgi:hypothetical protein
VKRQTDPVMPLSFQATIIEWRGPSPFFFAPIPADLVRDVRGAAKLASYGWGVVPVEAKIGGVEFMTSLFPKDDGYLLPIKARVRRRAGITAGDTVDVTMIISSRQGRPVSR